LKEYDTKNGLIYLALRRLLKEYNEGNGFWHYFGCFAVWLSNFPSLFSALHKLNLKDSREYLRRRGFNRNLGFMSILTGIILEMPNWSAFRLGGLVALAIGIILIW
jgi:hypothetical protein